MASEAAALIADLRAAGVTRTAIAQAIGRSERMVNKVQTGATPGNLYVPALRQMTRGDTVTPPPRRIAPGQQMTRAGRVVQVTSRGLVGLYQGLALDRGSSDRASITVEYKTSRGQTRIGTLYANHGRARGAILTDLENRGAVDGDSPAIRAALIALIHDAGPGGNESGASMLTDVRTIVNVTVSPA